MTFRMINGLLAGAVALAGTACASAAPASGSAPPQRAVAASPDADPPPVGPPRRTIFFESQTIVVTVRPPPLSDEEARQMLSARGEVRCVRAARIAEATMVDDRRVELKLSSGPTLQLTLGQSCPFLGFYGFFYVRPQADRLCAGRDFLLARSGQRCAVTEIARAPARR